MLIFRKTKFLLFVTIALFPAGIPEARATGATDIPEGDHCKRIAENKDECKGSGVSVKTKEICDKIKEKNNTGKKALEESCDKLRAETERERLCKAEDQDNSYGCAAASDLIRQEITDKAEKDLKKTREELDDLGVEAKKELQSALEAREAPDGDDPELAQLEKSSKDAQQSSETIGKAERDNNSAAKEFRTMTQENTARAAGLKSVEPIAGVGNEGLTAERPVTPVEANAAPTTVAPGSTQPTTTAQTPGGQPNPTGPVQNAAVPNGTPNPFNKELSQFPQMAPPQTAGPTRTTQVAPYSPQGYQRIGSQSPTTGTTYANKTFGSIVDANGLSASRIGTFATNPSTESAASLGALGTPGQAPNAARSGFTGDLQRESLRGRLNSYKSESSAQSNFSSSSASLEGSGSSRSSGSTGFTRGSGNSNESSYARNGNASGPSSDAPSTFAQPISDPNFTIIGSETDAAVKSMVAEFTSPIPATPVERFLASNDDVGDKNGPTLFFRTHVAHENSLRRGSLIVSPIVPRKAR